ncbi:hypothetical protein [Microbispora bryophytorum]|uniref:hypothetical protein n=1 Tax=Microbispora bryophytorum TaxID=1460882 RepID=UPI0033F82036
MDAQEIGYDEIGPLESAVRKNIEDLALVAPMSDALAEIAFNLARKLDSGKAVMASAAIGRELRETLQALVEAAGDDDSSELLSALQSSMPAKIRNAS